MTLDSLFAHVKLYNYSEIHSKSASFFAISFIYGIDTWPEREKEFWTMSNPCALYSYCSNPGT